MTRSVHATSGSIHYLNYGFPCGLTQSLVLGIVFMKGLPSHNSDDVIVKTNRSSIKRFLQEEQTIEYHGRLRFKEL